MDYETNFLDYLYEEMTAAEALIDSIIEYSRIGKIDTQALGELTEDELLTKVDSETTYVIKVIEEKALNQEDNGIVILEFQFKVVVKRSLINRIKWESLAITITLLALLSILGVILFDLKNSNGESNKRQSIEPIEGMIGLSPASSLPPPSELILNMNNSRNSITSFGVQN